MLKSAQEIVAKLTQNGFEAYFAGGVVRDMLLDRETSDVDIATSANPAEIEQLFEKTHPIGREFGVMLVVMHNHAFEVATFRGESDYDGRKPNKVFFTSVKEDAKRRDFTINGMFWNPLKQEILDFVEGEKDIKKKLIRFIGEAQKRVAEDHLRILRGVRFRNLLGFEYEEKTREAIASNAHLLKQISGERIRDELVKMMEDENRGQAFRDLEEMGILEVVIPEIMKLKGLKQPPKYHQEGDCFTHSLAALASLPRDTDSATAFATFFHDIGKSETLMEMNGAITYPGHAEKGVEIVGKILRRLRFDNATRAKIVWLIKHHMNFYDVKKMRLARKHEFFTHPWFGDLVKLTKADCEATRPSDLSLHSEITEEWKSHTREKLLPPPTQLLRGDEIIAELHVAKGEIVGRLLRILRDAQIEGLVKNRAEALKFLESCLKR